MGRAFTTATSTATAAKAGAGACCGRWRLRATGALPAVHVALGSGRSRCGYRGRCAAISPNLVWEWWLSEAGGLLGCSRASGQQRSTRLARACSSPCRNSTVVERIALLRGDTYDRSLTPLTKRAKQAMSQPASEQRGFDEEMRQRAGSEGTGRSVIRSLSRTFPSSRARDRGISAGGGALGGPGSCCVEPDEPRGD